MNKNIVFLLRLWPFFGGGETVTVCLGNEFARRGYNVHILYFKYIDNAKALPIDNRITTVQIEGVDCDDSHASELDSDKVSIFLVDYIKKNSIDVVINQWWPISYINKVKTSTKAFVIKCNHTAFFYPEVEWSGIKGFIKKLMGRFYLKRLYRSAINEVELFFPYVDKYVFLSDRFVKQFEDFGGDNTNNKVCSIPNPLVYDDFATPEIVKQKKNEVLFVGRMVDPLKRLSISLNAWGKIEKMEEFDSWSFTAVGDGPDKERLEEYSKKLGLRRVSFVGHQKPLSYYKEAKILVQNSKFEGFGMTILEAQQFGCVPVGMDTFLTIHDLIDSGKNGIIADNSIESFTDALVDLMRNEKKREEMAYRTVESSKKFSIQHVVDMWEELFIH